MESRWTEEEFMRCCGSRRFAKEMAAAAPFSELDHAVRTARHIWLNLVDVNGWLEAFAAHPAIGATSPSVSKWCKEEQSTAMSTATDTNFQELMVWNEKYREKFGFVFLICASGRSTPEILSELKKRYMNRPIVELELAANEEMKVTELRLAKLFSSESGTHLSAQNKTAGPNPMVQIRPPITTHVLDVSSGSPASGMEIHLEKWRDNSNPPDFTNRDYPGWALLSLSETNSDGRAGPLMSPSDYISPGFYRISFNTGKYKPEGFYPYVSVLFEVKEKQSREHFHVPLLHSPFSFTTYRGS